MTGRDPQRDRPTVASLPALDAGITLLEADADVRRAIHALAVDTVLLDDGDAYWVDPGTHAQTETLVSVAPSPRILDRVHVARGFTPFQHLDLLRSLPALCSDRTALVVVPRLDRYYRDDGLLGGEGQEMLLSGIAALAGASRAHDIPVLVTRDTADEFSGPVEAAATQTLTCQQTPFGPCFRGDGQETRVYPADSGQWVQTTLAFWEAVLAAREPLYDTPEAGPQRAGV